MLNGQKFVKTISELKISEENKRFIISNSTVVDKTMTDFNREIKRGCPVNRIGVNHG
jgi:hypothetical protein